MSYFIMYRFENPSGLDYYDSFVYDGKVENQKDFEELKTFIKTKRKRKGRLFIIRVTPLSRSEY